MRREQAGGDARAGIGRVLKWPAALVFKGRRDSATPSGVLLAAVWK